ncbi:putative Root phototropism protein [Tripterygium wilfordii]|uniref:Putative Root phototropism protein n=1 Tax=Tripterygium wilfordii TaxID=458696 RepID=A0A7J7DIB0_TRIWF|nr:BTB/POZ domain-containing protein At3g22104-like [Tripterygium wilfordii]KAF5746029.1 putative Root phototropism protein [Tripterygium wilfordii]
MAVCCDLQVDVNGEETFMVDKKIISSYSGRLRKLFGNSAGTAKNLKVIFHDFPGGAESFELMSRFCYNNGRVNINPSNIYLLYCAAQFMEMDFSVSGKHNLLEQTQKTLKEIGYWTWPELLVALKHCQELPMVENTSCVIEKCIDSLVGKMVFASELSPCSSISSPESSSFRVSCDTRSTESFKNCFSRATWWFQDLLVLSPSLVEMVIKAMIRRKFDHIIISKFIFYYQKAKVFTAKSDKCKAIETVIDVLYTLNWNSISCKSLFGILQVALSLRISKCCRRKLESMIGFQLDQATLDNLLVPSLHGMSYLYDVNLILRIFKAFLHGGNSEVSFEKLRKVSSLMDLYMAEVAPDPRLKASKFLALALALPDSARESHDEIYHAIDIYLEVHAGLLEEEKKKICFALNHDKLSSEARVHLSQNSRFPSKTAVQALKSQQLNLKSLIQSSNNSESYTDSPIEFKEIENKGNKDVASGQFVVYSRKLDYPIDDKEQLRAHIQGMQSRVMELEKVCRKMQTQMSKIAKSRTPNHTTSRSLPRLCS